MKFATMACALLVALSGASPVQALPKVVALGGDATADGDPVAACGALAASPYEAGWEKTGLLDKAVFLDGATAACEAAHAAAPDSVAAATWLGRVYILVGRADKAAPLLETAAGAGSAFAAYLLSGLLDSRTPNGVETDVSRADALLRQAAAAGFVPAALQLADRLETSADHAEALRLYELAAGAGDGFATYKLGTFYHWAYGVTTDYARAMQYYQQATALGAPEGWFGIGQLLEQGNGVDKNEAKAAAAYQQGADAGEKMSETALAYFYEQGLGVKADLDRSFALLTDAADQNYGFAQAALAIHYLFGEGTPVDEAKAFALAWAAQAKNVTYAEGILGFIYAEGLGTDRDLSQALEHFQAGAQGGDSYSADRVQVTELEIACQEKAGSPYEPGGAGAGVEFEAIEAAAAIEACETALDANADSVGDKVWLGRAYVRAERYDEALPLLEAGMDDGNALAETVYADLLRVGEGLDMDSEGAVELYRKAAEAGFAPAQYGLGMAYAQGNGVEADRTAAGAWLRRARENGFEAAQQQLDALAAPADGAPPDLIGFGSEGLAY